MKFVLKKKKIVLKTETNLHSVHWKTSKGTKKKKKKRIEKFETQNLRRDIATLVLVEDTEVTNKEEGKT